MGTVIDKLFLEKYSEYKITGIEWLGEIPSHWEVLTVKRLGKTKAGGTPSTTNLKFWDGTVPWLPSGKLQNCEINSAEKFITESGLKNSATKLIKPNTTLIALTGATCANIGYLKFEACANQSVIAIEEYENVNSKFLYYALINERNQILLSQTGGAQAGINETDVNNIILPTPNYHEQTAIAAFLDRKTALIDQAIDIKQKQIELLKERRQILIHKAVTRGLDPNVKLKDSGVDWIGEIPEGWEVKRLKYVFKILKRISGELGHDVLSITQTGIKIKDIESGEGQLSMDYSKYQYVYKGDFAMNHMDLLTGYVDISKYDGVISPDYRVFDLIEEIFCKEYMLLLLQMCYKNKVFYAHGQGVSMLGRWRFPSENFNNFLFPIPSKLEQEKIANFIDASAIKFASAISFKEQEIEKLKEYKATLINSAVTGKIKVC